MSAPDALARKAQAVRARATVRSWEYRQRRHAKGVWFRLRRLLADTRTCWEIPDSAAAQLIAEGFHPEPVGAELEPPKNLLVLPPERIEAIPGRTALRIGLSPELLAARSLALEPF